MREWRSRAARAVCALTGAEEPEGAVRALVDALLDAGEVSGPPVDLELLASIRRVRHITLLDMAEAGRLVPEGDAYVIQVNQRHSETKRRFTIAHEVGHTFFDQASKLARFQADEATGLFDLRDEEEYLCDLAAARSLLHPRWLAPLAGSRRPSIEGLIEVADTCQASIEATAIQLAQLGVWRCSFVFWEPGLRRSEEVVQAPLVGWEGSVGPKEKLRAKKVYAPAGVPFLPRNKSVDSDSHVWRAFSTQGRTEGEERLDLRGKAITVTAQSVYAPYYDESGVLRPRVISCLLWP